MGDIGGWGSKWGRFIRGLSDTRLGSVLLCKTVRVKNKRGGDVECVMLRFEKNENAKI